MGFRVELTPQAETDLEEIFDWVARQARHRAPVWFARLESAILSLGVSPRAVSYRSGFESRATPCKQLLFGRRRHVYRVYFSVLDDVVKILHVRHGARRRPMKLNAR